MDLELTPDQRELRNVARQALDARAPLSLARAFLEADAGAAPLHPLLVELGWYGVGLDDDDGFGLPGLVLLAEQVGAHAAPTALVDTAVAARVVRLLDGPEPAAILAGERSVALAVVEPESDWELEQLASTLTPGEGGRWQLTGRKIGVQHAGTVDHLLVVADADGSPGVALIRPGAAGAEVSAARGADPAAATATVTLDGVEVPDASVRVGEPAALVLDAAFAVGAVATAAEGIGAASAGLDLAIEYARERQQFGRAIGSFQALKHVIADAHVDREAAWSSILYAAAALDEGIQGGREAASIAAAAGARASRTVIEAALQVLGGIAFTWEHDVHLLQRRVLSSERRFGDALMHERRLGAQLAARHAEVLA